jgi:MOSC domain-containing protein YiiM
MSVRHLAADELYRGLDDICRSPKTNGRLEMIVRRPSVGTREILTEGQLDVTRGLVGDTWEQRGSSRTPDGARHPDMQINLMNARAVDLIAQERARWPLAGDQLYVDLDLSTANLPPATRLAIGSAVLEVTAQPHTGCAKFVERFGVDAMKFVNSPVGRELCLRGINARVVQAGTIREGDAIVVRPPVPPVDSR